MTSKPASPVVPIRQVTTAELRQARAHLLTAQLQALELISATLSTVPCEPSQPVTDIADNLDDIALGQALRDLYVTLAEPMLTLAGTTARRQARKPARAHGRSTPGGTAS